VRNLSRLHGDKSELLEVRIESKRLSNVQALHHCVTDAVGETPRFVIE
jgi:hypothetical protein